MKRKQKITRKDKLNKAYLNAIAQTLSEWDSPQDKEALTPLKNE